MQTAQADNKLSATLPKKSCIFQGPRYSTQKYLRYFGDPGITADRPIRPTAALLFILILLILPSTPTFVKHYLMPRTALTIQWAVLRLPAR